MKSLEVPLEDAYYDYLHNWAVRDHIDLNRWARHALLIKGPCASFDADPEIENTRKSWELAVNKQLAEGLYEDLTRALRKHGFELTGFFPNSLFVEKTRAAYTVLFDAFTVDPASGGDA
jgi:hypothetical protein